MPHIIHRSQIPRGLREPRERTYRRQLRRALASPALRAEQRARLQAKLDQLLGVNSPPPTYPVPVVVKEVLDTPRPPLVTPKDSPKGGLEALPGEQQMLRLLKAEIINIGKAEGVTVTTSMTKAKLVAEILAHRKAG